MPRCESRDHYEQEDDRKRQDGEEIRVQADEGVRHEEGDGMGRLVPGEEADETILEDKDDSDASIEAAEVVGH